MSPSATLLPTIKWAQRADTVFMTVDVSDCVDIVNDITEDKITCTFNSCGNPYAFEFEFHHPIEKDSVKFSNKRCLEFLFTKKDKEAEDSWTNINKGKKQKHIQIDWNKWVDSDDEGEEFDASAMQGAGQGGMPGMGGPGMPGMGGMGGPPGAGGMPDMASMMGGMGGAGGAGGMDMAALQQMMAGMGGAGGAAGPGGAGDFANMDFSKMGLDKEGEADSDDDLPDLEDDAKVD